MRESILRINAFQCDRAKRSASVSPRSPDWQFRLDEVAKSNSTERLKSLVEHHLARAIDENIQPIRNAKKGFLCFFGDNQFKTQIHENADLMFREFRIMQRIEPGVEALKRLGGGQLPKDIRRLVSRIWEVLSKVEEVRCEYYRHPAKQRLDVNVAALVEPLVAELKAVLLELFRRACHLYDLDTTQLRETNDA